MLHDHDKLLLIAGPCSLESREVCEPAAEKLAALRDSHKDGLTVVFKGSFDKANRTSGFGARGPGMDEGLELLAWVNRQFGLPVTTDVHLPDQCLPVARVCAVLQIPAFLCRQTDLLAAAAETGATVNVKKGQFLAPGDMSHVVGKLADSMAREIWQTERGTTFGYHNLVVDMRGIAIMRGHGHPVIFDATHSVQLPGGSGGASGGQREYVPPLMRAALAAGAQGLFIETHPIPANALSDGPSQVPLDEFPALAESALRLFAFLRKG